MNIISLRMKLALAFSLCGILFSASAAPKKILVVTVTTEFRHSSIPTAEKVLAQIAKESGAFTIVDYAQQPNIKVPQKPNAPQRPKEPAAGASDKAQENFQADLKKFEAAEKKFQGDLAAFDPEKAKAAQNDFDAAVKESLVKLSPENLKNYDGVIFANTTGNLPLPDKQGFIDWVKQGHAFIAMHSGSDTFHGFRPYIEMLGGEFQTHGAQVGIECLVQDMSHPAVKHFGESFCLEQEEVYLIKSFDRSTVHNLLGLDKHPNNKKQTGYFPVSWCKEFGTGKVFYTSLGHREDVWENKKYQRHVLGGIKWALGLEPGDATPGN